MIEKKKILIVGLGIGSVYLEELQKYSDEYNILTIDSDPNKNAKYPSCEVFRYTRDENFFEMVIICTPNFLHEEQIKQFAPISRIVLVEKPGVKSPEKWNELCAQFPNTKIIMVKNNLYRVDTPSLDAIDYFKSKDVIHLKWNNHNRIPFPGFWFTNKDRSFGGVEYDLLPHLLHFVYVISESKKIKIKSGFLRQNYKISDIESTDYGIINKKNPVYDVSDQAHLVVESGKKTFVIDTCWKYDGADEQTISYKDEYVWDFGLCPNSAYGNMVMRILSDEIVSHHYKIDIGVLETITKIDNLGKGG